ncbi:hypothetical protein EYC80_006144 [Monilinia laxa]|uniref:Uncharacterized protein n=1 Tax=Monilinia laxa TaxID=61186 RepID=A0A5N6KHT9_MONLA|nr:hypothetical protein EYC80_006144 [Monilinia laxa]
MTVWTGAEVIFSESIANWKTFHKSLVHTLYHQYHVSRHQPRIQIGIRWPQDIECGLNMVLKDQLPFWYVHAARFRVPSEEEVFFNVNPTEI